MGAGDPIKPVIRLIREFVEACKLQMGRQELISGNNLQTQMACLQLLSHYLPIRQSYINWLFQRLASFGVNNTIFCFKTENLEMFRGPEVHSFQELGVTAKARVRLFAKLNGRSSYLSEYFLGGHVRTRDLKVLHAHFLWMAPTAQEVKAKTGIPSCVTLYGEDDLFTGEAAKLHFRPALLSADVILVPSDYLLNVVRQILPELRDVRVWRIGVEVDRYAPPVSPLKERKTLLCVARLIERKGLDILIRAMPHVKKEHPDVLLKIVGEGNMRRNLESLIAELDCDSYVKIFPYQNSLQAYYSEADLYVQPSLREPNGITEGLGVCLLEAQASYLPIVASGVGGIPEAVGQNGGLLVRAGEPKDLADAISKLLHDENLRTKMGMEGRRWVELNYNCEKQSAKLLQIYESLT